ncbi:COX15/CtaA family protein [Paenibacillus sp. DMB20]|uniref:COX15/CtaA family protein n=1 Tax=Paenibacillus sp. DMB20 TaxID=1642570 RepID=UPI0006278328|nr:COX15/CtaA family protein [Paenibacillus sp. DMB20]KKO52501.1 cytochrome Caa3 oxidase [Paenibacillus sp. DMB20]
MFSLRYRLLAWSSFIGMFFVLLAGAIVTKTGSGRGCGDDWPLCNGKFVPAYTLESMIEYSHRLITGVVGLLVLLTFIVTWRYYKSHKEALYYAGGTLFFTIVQALMGAAAVMWPQQPAVMALHFGIALLAVASCMLLVVWMYRTEKEKMSFHTAPIPTRIRVIVWGTWAHSCIVIYLGAYIRHTESDAGCMGWPLCNGQVIPYMYGASGIVFIHRLAAALLWILAIILFVLVRRHEAKGNHSDFTISATGLLVLVTAQIFSGAWLTFVMNDSDVYLFASLVHNVLAVFLFSILAALSIRSWKRRMPAA